MTNTIAQPSLYRDILFPAANEKFIYTGPIIIDANQQRKQHTNFWGEEAALEIERFIREDDGRIPVYCGWGLIMKESPECMVEFVTRALMRCGERGIVSGWWAKSSKQAMEILKSIGCNEKMIHYASENILFVEETYSWI